MNDLLNLVDQDPIRIAEHNEIQKTCEKVELVTNITQGIFLGLTALGAVSMPFGAPFVGLMTAFTCGSGALLTRDIKRVNQFIKSDIESNTDSHFYSLRKNC